MRLACNDLGFTVNRDQLVATGFHYLLAKLASYLQYKSTEANLGTFCFVTLLSVSPSLSEPGPMLKSG